MLDYKETLVAKLKTIGIPLYYELFTTPTTPIPCLSYLETDNSSNIESTNLRYSNLSYTLKIWSKDVSYISQKAVLVDKAMKELGFSRVSTNEIALNGLIQKILVFRAVGSEKTTN